MNYDLHVHRTSLPMKKRNPSFLLNAVRFSGMDGVALVDFADTDFVHPNYEHFADAAKARVKNTSDRYRLRKDLGNAVIMADEYGTDILVIRGFEFKTLPNRGEGHLLALGLKYGVEIPRHLGLVQSARRVRKLGGAVVADHYSDRKLGVGVIGVEKLAAKKLIDGFEAYNANYASLLARTLFGPNPDEKEVKELERKLRIGGIAVSDAHNGWDIGNGYIETDNISWDQDLVDSIKHTLRITRGRRKFEAVQRCGSSNTSVASHIGIVLGAVYGGMALNAGKKKLKAGYQWWKKP